MTTRTNWKQRATDAEARTTELEARITELEARIADSVCDCGTDDVDDDDSVTAEHRTVTITAPAGTRRQTIALTAARVRPRLEDLRLRGIWTFTFRGRGC